jgi:thymidylate synthase (FAD)
MLTDTKINYLESKTKLNCPKISKNGFAVSVLDFSLIPQIIMYLKLHQCYSSDFVGFPVGINKALKLGETKCGEICVKRLLDGNRGHWGVMESPSITFSCGYIDHDSVMQARTHRIGTSFAVQSMRYTSEQFLKAAKDKSLLEEVIFLEQPGNKIDRNGNKFYYTQEQFDKKCDLAFEMIKAYAENVESGVPPEAARDILPHNYRQHFCVTFNLRSLLHFCDLRLKKDAQNNITELAELMYGFAEIWTPEICEYYTKNRKGKALLSP